MQMATCKQKPGLPKRFNLRTGEGLVPNEPDLFPCINSHSCNAKSGAPNGDLPLTHAVQQTAATVLQIQSGGLQRALAAASKI